MFQCPNCQYNSPKYKTVYKHCKRSHQDIPFVRGSIIQVQEASMQISPPPQPVRTQTEPDFQVAFEQEASFAQIPSVAHTAVQPTAVVEHNLSTQALNPDTAEPENELQQEVTHPAPNAVQFATPHETLDVSHQNSPVNHNEMEELENSLRTIRFSNVGLSLLVERTQDDLAASNARVTFLERAVTENVTLIANEVNTRMRAEGIATDFHCQLVIADFNRKHLQSQNDALQESVQQLTSSNNQILTENQTLTSLLDETKSQLIFAQEKAAADAVISATQIADLQSQMKDLEDKRRSDSARANSNHLSLAEQISALKEKVSRMVPISDIKDSHNQAQKWKTAFQNEQKKLGSLEQSVRTLSCLGSNVPEKIRMGRINPLPASNMNQSPISNLHKNTKGYNKG